MPMHVSEGDLHHHLRKRESISKLQYNINLLGLSNTYRFTWLERKIKTELYFVYKDPSNVSKWKFGEINSLQSKVDLWQLLI